MEKYQDRREAGKILAQVLWSYAHRKDVLVLALPRGGVPVAYEIANALGVALDVYIVRKLGVPGQNELAMGAIAMNGSSYFNEDIIQELKISSNEIQAALNKEEKELARRARAYRDHRPFPELKNKIIILVDDGIATGATIRAAIKALRLLAPASIIVAVPVAEKNVCDEIETLADEVICPLKPTDFYAVGAWYQDFSQTEDEEVHALLKPV